MTQCVLVNKIIFIGLQSFNYIHISIKNSGFVINKISHSEAKEIIDEDKLIEVSREEYNSRLGKIYADKNFKSVVNNNQSLKRRILRALSMID